MNETKYPPVTLSDDYMERLKSVPRQVFWAEEDEPQYKIPPEYGAYYPHSVALQYGLVKLAGTP